MTPTSKPRVVIVGAGFAGLSAAQRLRGAGVEVTLIDRNNYHTFVPLLYQVASAGLEPESIAQPVRRIVRARNVKFRLAEVTGFDPAHRKLSTTIGDMEYDYAIVAAGSVPNYFGIDSAARHTTALRDLGDAEATRNRLLRAFESAESEPDSTRRAALMTVVVVGGGPTGVELAGAIAELRDHVLPKDFPDLDMERSRVVLIEASPCVLPGMHVSLQLAALKQLRKMGVEVLLNTTVTDAGEEGVVLGGGERIPCGSAIWVAGLRAPDLATALPGERGVQGRVRVTDALQSAEDPHLFVVGDMAHVDTPDHTPHPMLAPVAIQQGALAAENILRRISGQDLKRFKYRDRGTMATIGRAAAVADIKGIRVTGFAAWMLWLVVHLMSLVGFRNRAVVLINWAWNYVTYDRGVRLIRER